MASMGVPMSEEHLQAGPSHVTPTTCSFVERVQVEPAAPASPTITISSCKEKKHQTSPAPTCTVLPYKDIQIGNSVQGPDAFDLVQGTLFPELMGQEPHIIILGEASDAKGIHTLFTHMGNYCYLQIVL